MSKALATVNTRIRVELARSRRNQGDLARALGISEAGVTRRMSGTTAWNVPELELVATFLGLELADLVTDDVPAAVAP